jgi:prefoldin subunit 5
MKFMIDHQNSLQYEIDYLKTQIREHDIGHIRTAISVLEERVAEIQKYIDDMWAMMARAQEAIHG